MYRYSQASNQSSFRSNLPLTNDEIARYAPSVLATEPHESRGERYAFIPTIDVLDGLRREGFHPYEVRQTRCRDAGKRDHTKHMIRLRHANLVTAQGEVPEVILLNSHDGTSSYQLLSGIFRFVCSNGLIAGDVCDDIRIRHTGNVIDDAIEGSYRVLDNIAQVTERIDEYKATQLTVGQQVAFAEAATTLRWGSPEAAPLRRPDQLLSPHRMADTGSDLWSTFNVVQENLIRGGLRGVSASGRRTRTREVAGVNENVRLNKALWTLADRLSGHVSGANSLPLAA